ncbi:YkuS family protein [Planococcus chinensis]|uniref:YkuS family protein n=1 Tax=Planococcus chinensis TaxID=272917 RepID=A0ABW4QDB9_9BACL
MVKVAVEEPFVSVKDALEKKGYNAEMLKDKTDAVDYDCVVVRDQESLSDFHMNVPLVEAHGRTLYEIVEEVEERLVRSGKIPAPQIYEESGNGGSGFIKGAVTGAIVGAAAGLLLTPKSGKEMQATLKEKTSGSKEKLSGTVEQVKGKTSGVTDKVKDKTSDVTDKAKGKVDELKAKREDKKEEKELKKQEKEVEKEIKAEEKAQKEHEKAEKKAEKEIKKAEKEAAQEKGGIEVVEFGASDVTTTGSGSATITPKDTNKK